MFGFLNPDKHNLEFRSVYARCCQLQRQVYGVVTLPYHSYESVFLYLCCLDANGIDLRDVKPQHCCKLRRGRPVEESQDSSVGEFVASASLLFAKLKLEDDIRDRSSRVAHLGMWVLSRPIVRAFDYFQSLDGGFADHLDSILRQQDRIERSHPDQIDFEEYATPTAEANGYLFSLLSRLPQLKNFEAVFTSIGQKIGAAMIIADCAADWQQDVRRGLYNPVKSAAAAAAADVFAQRNLREAISACQSAFGQGCRTSHVLIQVHDKIHRQNENARRRPALQPAADCMIPNLNPQPGSTTLYATCCIPCGDGACIFDTQECDKACWGCCGLICLCAVCGPCR